ncbi:S8 family serine peptidase [Actinoplanes sp. HUAS TT8]|uniref:S8 family serine peptidase n=1 Tax=Actinoplanes sp. HUAS TT8 TaxID=3447453 RepID=UPI003F52634F
MRPWSRVLLGGLVVGLVGVIVPVTPASAADCASAGDLPGAAWPRTMLATDSVSQLARGGGVTVAVLSTGVQAGNRQLAGRVLNGRDANADNGTANTDCRGLGTQVAGVIAAAVSAGNPVLGLAASATVLPVRVLPDNLSAQDATAQPNVLARGIEFAVNQGADVIVVAAQAYTDNDRLRTAVASAIAADIPVVAASGDLGSAQDKNPDPFPAAYPDVITVGAIDQNGKIFEKSGHGAYVDLVAPGVAVPTLQGGDAGPGGVIEADGTALAAGYVGATAALIRGRTGRMPVADLTRLLTASASPTVNGEAFGAGVVNPYGAVTGKATAKRGRALPALSAAAPSRSGAENQRRVVAFAGATLAAVAVVAVLMITAAVRRSRRQHWRPGLAPPLPEYDEPVEPGPPVMLLDTPTNSPR